jgi:hypothetical protein
MDHKPVMTRLEKCIGALQLDTLPSSVDPTSASVAAHLRDAVPADQREAVELATRELREEVADLRARNSKASDDLVAAREQIRRFVEPSPCRHLEGTPDGTRVCYLYEGRIYILGIPSEDGDHNCDEMGCGSVGDHVLEIIDLPEVGRLRAELASSSDFWKAERGGYRDRIDALEAEVERLRAENERLRFEFDEVEP